MKLSEKQVTEQAIDWLTAQGWTCLRLQSGLLRTPDGRYIRAGKKGVPDWICLRRGYYFLMETKAPGKPLSADQSQWINTTKTQLTFVRVDDLDDLIRWHNIKFK